MTETQLLILVFMLLGINCSLFALYTLLDTLLEAILKELKSRKELNNG